MVQEHYDNDIVAAWDDEEDDEEDEEMITTAPSNNVTHNYTKLSKRLSETISQMGVGIELQQLEVNKDDLGVTCVEFNPEFGYILIKMDLSRVNINLEHA